MQIRALRNLKGEAKELGYPDQMRVLPIMLALVLIAAACSGSTSSTTIPPANTSPAETTPSVTTQPVDTTPPATETSSAVSSTTTSAPPTTTSEPTDTPASVVVSEGQVDGPGRLVVKLGAQVSLSVVSDISDQLHVHGYDILVPITIADNQLLFTADIPGIFEIELEDAGLEILELVVEP